MLMQVLVVEEYPTIYTIPLFTFFSFFFLLSTCFMPALCGSFHLHHTHHYTKSPFLHTFKPLCIFGASGFSSNYPNTLHLTDGHQQKCIIGGGNTWELFSGSIEEVCISGSPHSSMFTAPL